MGDAGFSSDEVIALLASHSIAAQDEIEPAINRSPFDSTPATFDNQVFLEVQLRGVLFPGNGSHEGEVESPLPGEFRLQSDGALARDSRTACTWQSFARMSQFLCVRGCDSMLNVAPVYLVNQALMAQKFAAAMGKLSLLGQNQADLVDCTEIIVRALSVDPCTTQTDVSAAEGRPGSPQPGVLPGRQDDRRHRTGCACLRTRLATNADTRRQCATQAFPTTLSTQAGATTSVARVYVLYLCALYRPPADKRFLV